MAGPDRRDAPHDAPNGEQRRRWRASARGRAVPARALVRALAIVVGHGMTHEPGDAIADLRLVRAALQRDTEAIAALGERFRCVPRIVAHLNRRLGRPLAEQDVQDVAQDAVRIALERLADFAGHGVLDAWLYRFCHHELMNAIRRRRRHATATLPAEPADEALAREWQRRADRECLEARLARIGGSEAEVVRMRYLDGLDFATIATRQGTTVSAAKTRHYRGLRKLAALNHEPPPEASHAAT
jgi:RNA polymerase sigma factor (sigma-70 family)